MSEEQKQNVIDKEGEIPIQGKLQDSQKLPVQQQTQIQPNLSGNPSLKNIKDSTNNLSMQVDKFIDTIGASPVQQNQSKTFQLDNQRIGKDFNSKIFELQNLSPIVQNSQPEVTKYNYYGKQYRFIQDPTLPQHQSLVQNILQLRSQQQQSLSFSGQQQQQQSQLQSRVKNYRYISDPKFKVNQQQDSLENYYNAQPNQDVAQQIQNENLTQKQSPNYLKDQQIEQYYESLYEKKNQQIVSSIKDLYLKKHKRFITEDELRHEIKQYNTNKNNSNKFKFIKY